MEPGSTCSTGEVVERSSPPSTSRIGLFESWVVSGGGSAPQRDSGSATVTPSIVVPPGTGRGRRSRSPVPRRSPARRAAPAPEAGPSVRRARQAPMSPCPPMASQRSSSPCVPWLGTKARSGSATGTARREPVRRHGQPLGRHGRIREGQRLDAAIGGSDGEDVLRQPLPAGHGPLGTGHGTRPCRGDWPPGTRQ